MVLSFVMAGLIVAVAASERVSPAVTERLCEHVKQRKTMLVDKSQPDVIWSDGAMFEIARTFPSELQTLVANPTATRDLRLILNRMSGKPEDGWQGAKAPRSTRGQEPGVVESADGKLTLHVAAPYFNYLRERYPGAQIKVRSRLDAVLFLVDGIVRAAVMPVAQDAKPKQ